MRKLIVVAMLATIVLFGLASAAGASTIDVTNLGPEEQNIELQGRLEFSTAMIRITCNKTTRGHLNARVAGELRLLANEAGIIGDYRVNNCRGGTFIPLVALREDGISAPIRLSWIKVVNGGEIEIAGNDFRFEVEALGLRCLYIAEIVKRSIRPDANGLYREFRLRLLREGAGATVVKFSGSELCPRPEQITLSGTWTVTKPAGGFGVRLR